MNIDRVIREVVDICLPHTRRMRIQQLEDGTSINLWIFGNKSYTTLIKIMPEEEQPFFLLSGNTDCSYLKKSKKDFLEIVRHELANYAVSEHERKLKDVLPCFEKLKEAAAHSVAALPVLIITPDECFIEGEKECCSV